MAGERFLGDISFGLSMLFDPSIPAIPRIQRRTSQREKCFPWLVTVVDSSSGGRAIRWIHFILCEEPAVTIVDVSSGGGTS